MAQLPHSPGTPPPTERDAERALQQARPAATWTLRRTVNVGFSIGLLLLGIVGGVSYWSIREFQNAQLARKHEHDDRDLLARLLTRLTDAETGQRGFLLTGDAEYLDTYVAALGAVDGELEQLRAIGQKDPTARPKVVRLDSLVAARFAVLEETIVLRRTQGAQAALRVVATGRGKRIMDEIRAVIGELVAEGSAAAERWHRRAEFTSRVARLAILTGSPLALLFVLVAGVLINRDITKRSRVEAALAESESRLFQILEALPVAVFVVDAAGRPHYANRVSQEILGKGIVPEAAPEQLTEVYQAYVAGTNEVYPAARTPVLRALAGERVHTADIEIRRPDGVVPVEVWAAPVVDAAGRVVFAIAAFSDITERKRVEDALVRAKAAAEAANRTKSDFLAKMSHELRTPLNSIIGFSEVLADEGFGPLNTKQQRYVGNVLTSGRHLLQLINDILDLAKVEAGRMDLAPSEFDVAVAVAEVRTIVGAQADEKRLTLEADVDEGLTLLTADQQKFKQVLYNLLSNAFKFTPEGGRVRVTARRARPARVEDSGEWVEVAVADTGIGLRAEDLERIFGEFEQVDSEYARDQQGTGLGLALSRKLVELHGGRIWAESEVGQGSVFRFVLPLRGEKPVAPRPPAQPAAAASEPAGPLVLVVDDDEQSGDLLTLHLSEAGYRVARASNEEQTLQLARTLKPAAITLDILLRGENGMATLARLKARPETRDVPVVVVSVTEEQKVGFSLGAVDWLVKPVGREQLVATIHRAVGPPSPTRQPTVLVVDDEVATVELLTDILTAQGFRVLAAHDGRRGIALALAHRPDVIVLDLVMPELTGFDVVRELRAHPQAREIPILIFTVKDLSADERERLRGSVQAVVTKGGREELLRELARVCQREARSP